MYENQNFIRTDAHWASHVTTELWALPGGATVEDRAASPSY